MEPSDQAYTNEEQLIEDKFQELLNGYLNSNHRKKVEIIERAFKFAKEAHKGIRRRSGEPYILHPIAVARIVSQEIGLGSTSICAALLHDVVEDTEYTVEDIENHFGKKIASIVDGLTKISGGIFGDQASAQAENFRRLLLTMSEDIRVILIKMADRLHNMRTLGSMLPSKQYLQPDKTEDCRDRRVAPANLQQLCQAHRRQAQGAGIRLRDEGPRQIHLLHLEQDGVEAHPLRGGL